MSRVENLPGMLSRLRGDRSIRDVARSIEVAHTTVVRWESGASLPSLPMLRKLLRALGAGVHDGMAAESAWYDEQGKRGAA